MSVSYDYPILRFHWLSIYSQKCHFLYLLLTSPMPSHPWPLHLSCIDRWHNPGTRPRRPQGQSPCRQGAPSIICATFPSLTLLPQAQRLFSSKALPYSGAPEKHLTRPSYLPWAQLALARKVSRSNECIESIKIRIPPPHLNVSTLLSFYTGQTYLYSSLMGHKIFHVPFSPFFLTTVPWSRPCFNLPFYIENWGFRETKWIAQSSNYSRASTWTHGSWPFRAQS